MSFLRHAGVSIASIVVTVMLCVLYAVVHDAWRGPRDKRVVAFSDLFAEARAGRVESIDVDGRRYEFHVRGARNASLAFGPKTTEAELRAFLPTTDTPKLTVH